MTQSNDIQTARPAPAAKRIFGIPDFKYCALSDGPANLSTRHPGPPVTKIRPRGPDQLPLPL